MEVLYSVPSITSSLQSVFKIIQQMNTRNDTNNMKIIHLEITSHTSLFIWAVTAILLPITHMAVHYALMAIFTSFETNAASERSLSGAEATHGGLTERTLCVKGQTVWASKRSSHTFSLINRILQVEVGFGDWQSFSSEPSGHWARPSHTCIPGTHFFWLLHKKSSDVQEQKGASLRSTEVAI